MFFSVNKINAEDAERAFQYQLFQIAKRLSSNELMVLKASYETRNETRAITDYKAWINVVSRHLGHSLLALVELANKSLADNRLLNVEREFITAPRLTDLGQKLCENIESYRIEKARNSVGP